MKTLLKTLALAASLLLPIGGALAATDASSLQSAKAIVVSIDPANRTLVLQVPSLPQGRLAFSISPSCIYTNGLASLASLHINSQILVWTQGAQGGTLPVITKMARPDY